MGRMGKFSASDLKQLQKQLEKVQARDVDAFVEACAKELAARLLAEVIKRTPVGDYHGGEYECKVREGPKPIHHGRKVKGKQGGTLRRGWIAATQAEAESGHGSPKADEITAYCNGLEISHSGGIYRIDIINPVEYAPYVEYGHRTASHKGWVPGHFMLTISEQEIQKDAPRVLESKIKRFLAGCMG